MAPSDGRRKRLIRPLCYASKAVINQAAASFGIPKIKSCPYLDELERDGDRAFCERLLVELESRFGDLRQCMLASMRHVEPQHLLDPAFLDFAALAGREMPYP